MTDHEFLFFALVLATLWLSTQFGAYLRRRRGRLVDDEREDLAIVLTASLTLLGLIVGFSFSMAVTRYNQRKDCEAAEAVAIRSGFIRANLLPAPEAARIRELLKQYTAQRIGFYLVRDVPELDQTNAAVAKTQMELWSALQGPAETRQTPITALAISGVNDVLSAEGFTQAAWRNRIPLGAWLLMGAIAVCCNFLVGFTARRAEVVRKLFFVLPLLVSISLILVADIDNPRAGAILVHPLNLEGVAVTMEGR